MRILYLLCLILSLFSFSLENCDSILNNCVKKCNFNKEPKKKVNVEQTALKIMKFAIMVK